jgi:hypothetical protein
MKILLLSITFTLVAFTTFGQTIGKIVEGEKYKGIIFPAEVKIRITDTVTRWTPSESDIIKFEEKLKVFMNKQIGKQLFNQGNHCPIIFKNLSKYIRQYAGYISPKGEKMIYINCFWYEQDDPFSKDWQTKFIQVFDGCSYYWQIHYNPNSQELFGFSVNGIG